MKVVLNRSIGPFLLSDVAVQRVLARKRVGPRTLPGGPEMDEYRRKRRPIKIKSKNITIDRADPDLVLIVEELGLVASGSDCELMVVDIPDNVDWRIGDLCGIEYVTADGRTWPAAERSSEQSAR